MNARVHFYFKGSPEFTKKNNIKSHNHIAIF